jgi:hypothetical protein
MGGNMDSMLLTDDEQKHLHRILTTYRGDGTHLQAALGALLIGKVYGWRVLRVCYTGATYTKYQRTLELDFKDWCDAETPYTSRHRGYQVVGKLSDFWKIVRGDIPQPEGLTEVKRVFG